jgi:hypothetical protein
MMSSSPTPEEIAAEAREALRTDKGSPDEHFTRLVRLGWINARGEVTKFLGGEAEPEPNFEKWKEDGDRPTQNKKKRVR